MTGLPRFRGSAIKQRRLGSGRSGIVVKVDYDKAAKFRKDNNVSMLEKECNLARHLRHHGVRVPAPDGVYDTPYLLGETFELRPAYVQQLVIGTPIHLLTGLQRELAQQDLKRQYEKARRHGIMSADRWDGNRLWVPGQGVYVLDLEAWKG